MTWYILSRILLIGPTLVFITFVSFLIIVLPPGDFLTSYVASLAASGTSVDTATLDALRESYGIGRPFYVQYWKWISGILFRGDFGMSFEWNQPVSSFVWNAVGLTLIVSGVALIVTWLVAIPIGILSAVKQYSTIDYAATFFAFLGIATPEFLLALVLMIGAAAITGADVSGLFSAEFAEAPWSFAKLKDMFSHLWVPVLVLSFARLAVLIRVLRSNLLDELSKPYLITQLHPRTEVPHRASASC